MDASHVEDSQIAQPFPARSAPPETRFDREPSLAERVRLPRIAAYWSCALLVSTLPVVGYGTGICSAAIVYLVASPLLWHLVTERFQRASTIEVLLTALVPVALGLPWTLCVALLGAVLMARVTLHGYRGAAWLCPCLTLALAAAGWAAQQIWPDAFYAPRYVVVASLLWLLAWGLLVAQLSYRQSLHLHRARRVAEERAATLADAARRLGKYLSPQLHQNVFATRTEERRRPVRRWISVCFADASNFTPLAERLEPEELAGLLNALLGGLAEIALAHGGTVDKFLGDGLMVFFGDPESRGRQEDARACVGMAMAMQAWLDAFAEKSGYGVSVQMRMGVASGMCTVGDFGTADRLDYTVLGTAVNLASRLEARAHPGQILMSAATHGLLGEQFAVERVGELTLKGLSNPVEVWAVADGPATDQLTVRRPGVLIQVDRRCADVPALIAELTRWGDPGVHESSAANAASRRATVRQDAVWEGSADGRSARDESDHSAQPR